MNDQRRSPSIVALSRRSATIVVAAAIAFGLAEASAGEPWVIVARDPQASTLERELRPALKELLRTEVHPLSKLRSSLTKSIEPASAETARVLAVALDGAVKRYYYHSDQTRAARTIERSVREAMKLLPRLLDRRRLWASVRRASMVLANVALGDKEVARARTHCAQIARRDRSYRPPPADVPPRVRKLYASVHRTLWRRRSQLKVRGATGAEVFIDGIRVGKVPLVTELAPGTHTVQALDQGVLTEPTSVDVPPEGKEVIVDPYCTSAKHLVSARCRDAILRADAAAALLEIGTAGTIVKLRVWRRGKLVRSVNASLPVRTDPAWIRQLGAYAVGRRRDPPVLPTVGPLAAPLPTERASKPVYRRWWFWTIIGVGVAGGLAGALLAPRPSPSMQMVFSR